MDFEFDSLLLAFENHFGEPVVIVLLASVFIVAICSAIIAILNIISRVRGLFNESHAKEKEVVLLAAVLFFLYRLQHSLRRSTCNLRYVKRGN